ncbi:DUF4253 domain-containing protein [Actinosynnema sp. NPDC050436]|uniref:DUF4253 domain-containing protein n=1 Tax=Actinosynnema sp. NPDC050436 TaxID=3155659 RepID=UPI00340D2E72
MTTGTPPDLSVLHADPAGARPPSTPLPPGRLVVSSEENGNDRPLLWLSDGPPRFGLWDALRAEHAETGLWPLLLEPLGDDDSFRPWGDGELWPSDMSAPGDHDPAALLAGWWAAHTAPEEPDAEESNTGEQDTDQRPSTTAPFGRAWPGLAPAPPARTDPDRAAAEAADVLASVKDELRLGLVAAGRGADALTAVGWTGPANYTGDTAEISAVLRDWEDRFGARVVAVGFATLYLSVGNPPSTPEHALRVAAEHFAFCPDNVWQGGVATLADYAERLVDSEVWAFWWD